MKKIILAVAMTLTCLRVGADQGFLAAMPDFAAVRRTVSVNWKIKTFDERPSVKVDGEAGYSLVLATAYRVNGGPHFPNPAAAQEIRYHYTELVLFPDWAVLPKDIKNRLQWSDIEKEPYAIVVDMGNRFGFRWFAKTSPQKQEFIRKQLGILGGDDPVQIQVDLLEQPERRDFYWDSAIPVLASYGNAAVPYLKKAIEKHADDPSHQIMALGHIDTRESTEYLQSLYWSGNERISRMAGSALASSPFREAAKREYLDMLGKRWNVAAIAEACEIIRWKDSLPLLEDICKAPASWLEYWWAFEAMRSLQCKPVPSDLVKAQRIILDSAYKEVKQDGLDKAESVMAECPDKGAAAVMAAGLAVSLGSTPARKQVQQIGLRLFKNLPDECKRPVISAFTQTRALAQASNRFGPDDLDPLLSQAASIVP